MADTQQVTAKASVDASLATTKLAQLQQAQSQEVVSPPAKFQCLASADDIEFSPSNMLVYCRHDLMLLLITFGRSSLSIAEHCLSVSRMSLKVMGGILIKWKSSTVQRRYS